MSGLFVSIRLVPDLAVEGLVSDLDNLFDRDAVLIGKGKVTLVMCGYAHDGTVAITH